MMRPVYSPFQNCAGVVTNTASVVLVSNANFIHPVLFAISTRQTGGFTSGSCILSFQSFLPW